MDTTTSTGATAATGTARLYRSSRDKVIAGVCGGLAAYFKIDPAIVRLAFVFFALAGGASILLYIVLWIAVPLGDVSVAATGTSGMNGDVIGYGLVALGGLWLLGNLGLFTFVNWNLAWPVLLIGLGAALLFRRS